MRRRLGRASRRQGAAPASRRMSTTTWRRALSRPLAWVGAVLTAVLIGLLTWAGQRVLEPAVPQAKEMPDPAGPPVKVMALQRERISDSDIWAFPDPLRLPDADLEALNDAVRQGGPDESSVLDPWMLRRGAWRRRARPAPRLSLKVTADLQCEY
jgi:hypothetical protein